LKQNKPVASANTTTHFFVKCEGKIEKVMFAELQYIEAMANYIILHTINNKLIVYLTIKGILEKLPADTFLQVHKSYIVNVNAINTIEGNMLHVGKVKITVGQNFYDSVMPAILKDRFIKR